VNKDSRNLTKEDVRQYVKPLVWSDECSEHVIDCEPSSEWYAFGVSEHVIWKKDGMFGYWSPGEGPLYATLEEAKKAANENHIDEVLSLLSL